MALPIAFLLSEEKYPKNAFLSYVKSAGKNPGYICSVKIINQNTN